MRQLFIFAVAVALLPRIAAVALTDAIPNGDPVFYLAIAESVSSGDGMRRFSEALGIEVRAFQPPFYPLLLAAVPCVAPLNFTSIAILNTLIDLAAAGAILWLAKTIRARGEIAAVLYLLLTASMAAIPHKEGLTAALAVACAAAAVERRPVILGTCAALLSLAQPGLAALPVLFCLFLLPARLWLTVALTGAAVMLPWWIRNWLVFDAFVPLTTAGGYGFWNAVFAGGTWAPLPPHLLVGSEIGISRAAGAEAWAWAAVHPLDYLRNCLAHLGRAIWAAPLTLLLTFGLLTNDALKRLALICGAHVILFQMWFEIGARHLFYLIPFGLIMVLRWIEPYPHARSGDGTNVNGRVGLFVKTGLKIVANRHRDANQGRGDISSSRADFHGLSSSIKNRSR